MIFAACSMNSQEKTEICSNLDSEMYITKDNQTKSPNTDNSHPIFLPKNRSIEKDSHPMVISPCLKPEE